MQSYSAKLKTINCPITNNGKWIIRGSMRGNQSEYSKAEKNIHPE